MLKKHKSTFAIVMLLLVVYYLLTSVFNIADNILFPSLLTLAKTFIRSMPELLKGTFSSFRLLIPSLFLAVVFGIALGLIIGWYKVVNNALMPIIYGLSPIPAPLYTPYAIMLLPTFWHSSVFIIFIGSFWSVLNGTINGVSMIEKKYIDNAKTLEIKGVKLLTKIIFPAALPSILNGIGSGLNFSFILLTIAEMFGAESGLGYFVQYYSDFAQYDKVLVGIIYMSSIIVIIMTLFDKFKRRALLWTKNK